MIDRVSHLIGVLPSLSPSSCVVWHQDIICPELTSVKNRNLRQTLCVALTLDNISQPVICEGQAEPVPAPWPADVVELFRQKYDWDISTEEQYAGLIEVTPEKWLAW